MIWKSFNSNVKSIIYKLFYYICYSWNNFVCISLEEKEKKYCSFYSIFFYYGDTSFVKFNTSFNYTSIFNLFGLLPYSVPSFLEVGLLPCLMGGSMALQMRLSPGATGNSEMEKVQRTMFKWMPLIITIILAPFASGLILYWTCTNCLTIIQQWYLNKTIKVKQ